MVHERKQIPPGSGLAAAGAASSEGIGDLIVLFRLLSDPTRLSILFLLANGERSVTSLCRALRLPQPTISHHLGILRARNVVSHRRKGKQVFYALSGVIALLDSGDLEAAMDKFWVRIIAKSAR